MAKLKSIEFNPSCKIEEEYWYSYRQSIVDNGLIINTLEGNMKANVGDYIIKGLKGEFYPCKPDVFHEKYEVIE